MQFVYPLDKNLFSSVHVIRTELEFERDRKTEYLKKHSQNWTLQIAWTLLKNYIPTLTESEVIKGNLRPRPWCIDWAKTTSIHQGRGPRFPSNDSMDEVNIGLFIMDLSLRSFKTKNWLTDNFTKTCHLNELYTWACDTVMWHGSADTLFDSCQLTITWMSIRMSTIKLNTDCICIGYLASKVITRK